MRLFRIFGLIIVLGAISSESQASCVTIALIDDAGSVVKPNGLVTAFKVGPTSIFVSELPVHTEQREVGVVNCPPEVVRPVQDSYNSSCLTEEARQLTASANGSSYSAVTNRCNEMAQALSNARLER